MPPPTRSAAAQKLANNNAKAATENREKNQKERALLQRVTRTATKQSASDGSKKKAAPAEKKAPEKKAPAAKRATALQKSKPLSDKTNTNPCSAKKPASAQPKSTAAKTTSSANKSASAPKNATTAAKPKRPDGATRKTGSGAKPVLTRAALPCNAKRTMAPHKDDDSNESLTHHSIDGNEKPSGGKGKENVNPSVAGRMPPLQPSVQPVSVHLGNAPTATGVHEAASSNKVSPDKVNRMVIAQNQLGMIKVIANKEIQEQKKGSGLELTMVQVRTLIMAAARDQIFRIMKFPPRGLISGRREDKILKFLSQNLNVIPYETILDCWNKHGGKAKFMETIRHKRHTVNAEMDDTFIGKILLQPLGRRSNECIASKAVFFSKPLFCL